MPDQNAPYSWNKTNDGCWYTDESCPKCGGLMVTNRTGLKWCVQSDHDPPAS